MSTMRPLILDETTRETFAKMVESAKLNCLSAADMERHRTMSKAIRDIAGLKDQVCKLPFGYRVVFTIEEQPAPIGWTRHISVSVTQDEPGKQVWPNPYAVEAIMECFGFTGGLKGATCVYQEEKFSAINVIQTMEKP